VEDISIYSGTITSLSLLALGLYEVNLPDCS